MTTSGLALTMLVVFVIAAIFLFVAFLLLNRRPPADGTAQTAHRRRRGLAASILCLVVGLVLMAPTVVYLVTAFALPA